MTPVDYGLHGRQIALPELGADGQRSLAEAPVDLPGALAAELHARAGGRVEPGSAVKVGAPDVPPVGDDAPAALALGAAAWSSVEAARRVLGEAPKAMPAALVERLTVPGAPR